MCPITPPAKANWAIIICAAAGISLNVFTWANTRSTRPPVSHNKKSVLCEAIFMNNPPPVPSDSQGRVLFRSRPTVTGKLDTVRSIQMGPMVPSSISCLAWRVRHR